MNRIVFGRFESSCIMINLICAKMLFMAPRLFTLHSLTAVFLVLAIDLIISALIVLLFVKLMPAEGADIISLAEKYLGRPAGILISFCAIILMLTKILTQTRISSSLITNQAYTAASPFFLNIVIYGAAILIAYFGIETISRLHALFVPISFTVAAIVISMSIPNVNTSFLFPILGYGMESIKNDIIVSMNCFTDWFVILLLLPYMKKKNLFSSCARNVFILSSIITVFVTVLFCGVSSGAAKNDIFSPALLLVQFAKVAGHIFRMDVFLLFIWNFLTVLYTCTLLFFCTMCIKKIFKSLDEKMIAVPLGISLFSVSIFTEDHPFIEFLYYYSHIICEVCGFAIPFLMLMLIYAKRRRAVKS